MVTVLRQAQHERRTNPLALSLSKAVAELFEVLLVLEFLHLFGELRHRLEEIRDEPVVGDLENRRFSVSTGRSDLVSLKATNFVLIFAASRLTDTFSTSPAPSFFAASKAVARTDTTRGLPSSLTVAITLPAYIGRVRVPSSLK